MIIYDCEGAPNPRRLSIFLAEKNITISKKQINILEAENLSERYLKINPFGLLPSLELKDGNVLSEVPCICQYLESIYPEVNLVGTNAIETAKILAWDRFSEMNGMNAIAEIFRNQADALADRGLPGLRGIKQIPELVERGEKRATWYFNQLENNLCDGDFLISNRFTLADITAFCVIESSFRVGLSLPSSNTNLQKWYNRLKEKSACSIK